MSKTNNPFGKQGWTPDRLGDLSGKTYLITGANSGAGFEAAKMLLAKGAAVVMLNRNAEKSTAAIKALKAELGQDIKVSFIQLDLASLASVRKASEQILQQVEKIDALICNGAIAQVVKQKFTQDGFESQLGVNHYGHFLLCGLLFERLEASQGRLVVVGSEGYKMGLKTIQFDDMNFNHNYQPNRTYCHSKLAQILFAYALQDRIKAANKRVKVYVCHPGASKTSLINDSHPPMTRIMFKILSLLPIVQSATEGAYPEVMCATEAEENLNQPAYYGPTGVMQWSGPVGECELEPHAKDKAVAQKLWAVSEQATGFTWDF